MKKLIVVSLALLSTLGAVEAVQRTTTRTYEESNASPLLGSQMGQDTQMLDAHEAEIYSRPLTTSEIEDNRRLQKQEMEERNNSSSTIVRQEEAVNYKNRTRTDRERKAIHTGGNASDDQ